MEDFICGRKVNNMTNEEALKWHRMNHQSFIDAMWDGTDNNPFDEAFGMAISALEKQIPMKPKLSCEKPIKHKMVYECGKCGGKFLGTTAEYCSHCGQRIDWEGIRASE